MTEREQHGRAVTSARAATHLSLVQQDSAGSPQAAPPRPAPPPTFFTTRAGVRCAGVHLIVDLFGASRLDDLPFIEQTLRDCVEEAGATLLNMYLHPFEPNGGVSGVAVLAESHISIHSWPETGYAALDIFMCGNARPERCINVLLEAFAPRHVTIEEILRGRER